MGNPWQETVKRVAKMHPGKSLKHILPLAKIEYRKMALLPATKLFSHNTTNYSYCNQNVHAILEPLQDRKKTR